MLTPATALAQAGGAAVPAGVAAQELTLERLFASPSLSGSAPRGVGLSPDGRLVTLLRNRPDDLERYDLWAIDPATGAARMLVDSKKFATGATLSATTCGRSIRPPARNGCSSTARSSPPALC